MGFQVMKTASSNFTHDSRRICMILDKKFGFVEITRNYQNPFPQVAFLTTTFPTSGLPQVFIVYEITRNVKRYQEIYKECVPIICMNCQEQGNGLFLVNHWYTYFLSDQGIFSVHIFGKIESRSSSCTWVSQLCMGRKRQGIKQDRLTHSLSTAYS